jgi:hypothetical protein
MTLDRQVVAERLQELRSTLPGPGELLLGLQRVTEATRAAVQVDGAGLTLAHEGGPPRWVAVSDAAMELLEQVQQDLADGPCVAAWTQDRIVAVEDLRAASAWDRVAAMVAQLQVRGCSASRCGWPSGRSARSTSTPAIRGPGRPRRSMRLVPSRSSPPS